MGRVLVDSDRVRAEKPSPDPDGVTSTFTVTLPYRPHTLEVYLNGILCARMSDTSGVIEHGGVSFSLSTTPLGGDTLLCIFEVA